jgi:signal transduction histidine kinase
MVHLVIADDGPGFAPDVIARPGNGHRGLADMVTEATACGGEVEVGAGPTGSGTVVTFVWRGGHGA